MARWPLSPRWGDFLTSCSHRLSDKEGRRGHCEKILPSFPANLSTKVPSAPHPPRLHQLLRETHPGALQTGPGGGRRATPGPQPCPTRPLSPPATRTPPWGAAGDSARRGSSRSAGSLRSLPEPSGPVGGAENAEPGRDRLPAAGLGPHPEPPSTRCSPFVAHPRPGFRSAPPPAPGGRRRPASGSVCGLGPPLPSGAARPRPQVPRLARSGACPPVGPSTRGPHGSPNPTRALPAWVRRGPQTLPWPGSPSPPPRSSSPQEGNNNYLQR